MEKELHFNPESQEKRFGTNVQIHAIFMRHGEKDESGELTEEGKRQATELGNDLVSKDAIKAYSSPAQRVLETVQQVVEAAPHDKKLNTRIRTELGLPPSSKLFSEKFEQLQKGGGDKAVEWYLSFGDKNPDSETTSPHEIAESLAYIITKYLKMAGKLYSGSSIDLINGTHQGLPEALLKEVLKRKIDDKKEIIGFDNLEEIGGALKFAESMEFLIKTDEQGNKSLRLNFRGQTYDLEMDKLSELAKSYAEKQKHE